MLNLRNCQIVCMTNDEKISVLNYIADNYPQVRWNSGTKLTKYSGYNAPMSLFFHQDNTITHIDSIERIFPDFKLIMAKDLLSSTYLFPSKKRLMEFLCEE